MFNYELLIQELRDSFGETDEANAIATKLENLEMSTGAQGFEEYWTEFQSHAQRLRYNDVVNMRLFRKGLAPYIKDKLTYLQQEPGTLNELRKATQNINNRHSKRQAECKREQARAMATQTLEGGTKGVSSWNGRDSRDLQRPGVARPSPGMRRPPGAIGPRPPLSGALSQPPTDEIEEQRLARETEEKRLLAEAAQQVKQEEQTREHESKEIQRLSNKNDSLKTLVTQLQQQFEKFKQHHEPLPISTSFCPKTTQV
jgi:hypothetical protein